MRTLAHSALWCKSHYSFLEGASEPGELVEEAQRLGLNAIAITDRDGVYGVVRAFVRARELGVRLIIGSEITVAGGGTIVLLCMTRGGYANLCRLVTAGRLRSPKGECLVHWDEVCAHAEGLIALWKGTWVYPGSRGAVDDFERARTGDEHLGTRQRTPENARQPHPGVVRNLPSPGTVVESPEILAISDAPVLPRLKAAFGDRLYALVSRHRQIGETERETALRAEAERHGVPIVATKEILYHTRARRDLQDVLTCIRHGVTLQTAGTRTRPNAEHALESPHGFGELFRDDPEAIARTNEIADRCTFTMEEIRYRYPSERLPDGTTSSEWLRALAFAGAGERYGARLPVDVVNQIEDELALIHELEYDGYFLTMWEIVRFCRSANILCQGRGSAANSAVCYVLGITAVDPVRMGLLFERFLSRERGEPPDIDLDIEHDRREEVIQHVYAKYGRTHAAMVANIIRYRARSAVREVGKALGLPETGLDRIARMLSHYDGPDVDTLREAGFDPESAAYRHLLRLTLEIQDVPRHLSIHPGGFLLGHEPVPTLVPIENATMEDRTVIQWDKEAIEDLGLFKVDLLGLGALNVVHRAFDLIERHTGETHTMASIPPDDEPTFEMIRAADTIGTFQIESRAQMAMLPRLLPRNYYDIVVEVSIVRPGPITGGMVHPFLRRRRGEEKIEYAHPSLEPILKKTLGVPIFQEQVMQLAIVAASYSAGEADQLRRDMAAWRRSGRIERHRERLITRMIGNGIPREFAERVFDQIRGFGEYGFPESHAASFALIAYATAWLKRHYPAAFVCSLLNAQPMGFYSPATLVDDSKRHGIVFRSVDVTVSARDCTLEPCEGSGEGLAVRTGLRYVKGFADHEIERLVTARASAPFRSLQDLVNRSRVESGTLTRLAEAGALSAFEPDRRRALWAVHAVERVDAPKLGVDGEEMNGAPLFDTLTPFETIGWDYAVTGHSPRGHPLEPLRDELSALGLPDARTVRNMKDGTRVRYAGLVICRQRPGTAAGVVFMTLEDETGFVNVVLWKDVFEKNRIVAKTTAFLGVSGKLQVESNVVHLIAQKLWRPNIRRTPSKKSRDFH